MKLHAASTLLAAIASLRKVDAQTTHSCPAAGSTTTLPITSVTTTPTTIRIPIISASDGLCILTRRNSQTGTNRAPVARSYASLGWEQSPGLFARTNSGASVDCTGGSSNECDVTVPPLDEGMEYVLESYMYSLSQAGGMEAEAARFLEQATFGSTRDSIDSMNQGGNDYAAWVENQLSLPMSSHRAFYRQHTNPKYEFPYLVGATGPRPCELHSRWRRYAITSRDLVYNRKVGWYKHLTVDPPDANGRYVWKVDGYFRTVTTDVSEWLELGQRYRIPHNNGATWKTDCVGCTLVLVCPTCSDTAEQYLSNPAVSVEGIDPSILGYNIVSLPDFKSTDLPTIEDSNEYPMFDPWIKPYENALLNTTSLEGSPGQCDGFPTFRQPFPLDDVDSPPGSFPAVFGESQDNGVEVTFAYDPHLKLYENTILNPLMDGGGQLVMDTHNLGQAFFPQRRTLQALLPPKCLQSW